MPAVLANVKTLIHSSTMVKYNYFLF